MTDGSERKGQRREPAADDVRISLRANRLTPVRWTAWLGSKELKSEKTVTSRLGRCEVRIGNG